MKRLHARVVTAMLACMWLESAFAGVAPARCVEQFEPDVDYFPDKVTLRHAQGFSIEYRRHYKVLTVYGHALERAAHRDVTVLVQCGTPAPPLVGELSDAAVVTIPVATIAANEDLSLYRSWLLGAADRVVGMGGEGVYTPDLRSRWEARDAVAIGESFHGPPNYERLLELDPGVVFLSTASLARAGSIRRARDLGVNAVPSLSWAEATPLGQAEWLHHVAVFLNAEATSTAVFNEIEERYQALSARASAKPAQPMLVWFDPGGQRDRWQVPENNWITRLVADAGGATPWSDDEGELTRLVTSEDILMLSDSISHLITTTVGLRSPGSAGSLESLPAMRAHRLYDVHRRSRPEHDAYDWYESAVVDVHRVLEDLVRLLHPELLPHHDLHHLRPVRGPGSD